MRYFLDTEFLEDGKTIMPISLGIVAQDARELYIEMQFDQARVEAHPWLRENVLPHLRWKVEERLNRATTAATISEFIGEDPSPEFWAYFADYDWVVICQIFGTMMELPRHFPKFCMDLQQWYVQLGRPDGVKPPQPVDAHDALADARWNAEFYERLAAHGDSDDHDELAAELTVARAEKAEQALEEARTVVDEQHAEILTLRTERHQDRTERDALWVLLDDIDTASDIHKDDYEGLAKRVYALQQRRHDITSGEDVDVDVARSLLRSTCPPSCSHPPCHSVSNADGEGRTRCNACGAWREPGAEWPAPSTVERGDPSVAPETPSPRST